MVDHVVLVHLDGVQREQVEQIIANLAKCNCLEETREVAASFPGVSTQVLTSCGGYTEGCCQKCLRSLRRQQS